MADNSAARAIGALIWKDPSRVLEAAAKLRGTDAVLECRLRGGSMSAAIHAGSLVRIAMRRGPPWRVGEVVAFVQGAGLCVHRVAHRRGAMLVTQGDACYYPDEAIDEASVLALVTECSAGERWQPVTTAPDTARARSAIGRTLLAFVAALLVLDVGLARLAARALRLRKEGPARIERESEAGR